MEILWQELTYGIPNNQTLVRILIRLVGAMFCGAALGCVRERAGKTAGLRTHILVTFGSCSFVLAGSLAMMTPSDLSRVIQGIVTGIGFIGAGAIIKSEQHIRGLTSAAAIWIAAAIGVFVGLGELGIALFATAIAAVVLTILKPIERKLHHEPCETEPPV